MLYVMMLGIVQVGHSRIGRDPSLATAPTFPFSFSFSMTDSWVWYWTHNYYYIKSHSSIIHWSTVQTFWLYYLLFRNSNTMGICQSSSSFLEEEEELQTSEYHVSSKREINTSNETRVQFPKKSYRNHRFHKFGMLSDDVILEM